MITYNLNEELCVVAKWFYNISRLADDKKTANGVVMSDEDALREIKIKSKYAVEYIEKYLMIENYDICKYRKEIRDTGLRNSRNTSEGSAEELS